MLSYDQDSHIRPMTLSSAQTALARHHTYTLFSRLFLEGVTAELRPFLSPIPELSTVLPKKFNADESAAIHHHLFRLNLFPFESIFLATEGLLGGPVANQVQQMYEQSGYMVNTSATSPDQIGHELAFLAYLCGAEADAWEDGLENTAVSIQTHQHTFLQHHLLRWLPPFVLAVEAQGNPFYSILANLVLDFASDHASNAEIVVNPHRLPDLPSLLENDKTSLKDIANYLITPAYSGFFLSRDHISHIAREHQLPRGFGNRSQMLTNLMKTAVQYDLFPTLINTLQATATAFSQKFEHIIQTHPQLGSHLTPWQDRCLSTIQILEQIKSETMSS
ncbi:MAG: hypothetical protein DWQ04_27280 [Chloroflexi bacterium]|nr:MAG: hypothetical protein DWQ04_27280 [Chloroflexota bacterium]